MNQGILNPDESSLASSLLNWNTEPKEQKYGTGGLRGGEGGEER
jgi:hypothetical protein